MKGQRVKLSSPVESWETGGPLNLNEGPEILKNGEKVFVIYSCRESWLVEYRQGMLQLVNSDGNLLDPANWKKDRPGIPGEFASVRSRSLLVRKIARQYRRLDYLPFEKKHHSRMGTRCSDATLQMEYRRNS